MIVRGFARLCLKAPGGANPAKAITSRAGFAFSGSRKHPASMTHAPLQPGVTVTYAVKGYTVLVTLDGNGVHRVTCPDLPQLSVSDGSLNGTLALAEDGIAAILAGRLAQSEKAP